MAEQRIPITARQHAKAAALIQEQALATERMAHYCESILDALPVRPAAAGLVGVSADEGKYHLVVNVTEPPKES